MVGVFQPQDSTTKESAERTSVFVSAIMFPKALAKPTAGTRVVAYSDHSSRTIVGALLSQLVEEIKAIHEGNLVWSPNVRGGYKIPKKGGIKFPTSCGNMVSYGGKTIIGGPKEDDNIGRIS
jgi:hypothetical protein